MINHLRNTPALLVLDGLEPNQNPRHSDDAGELQKGELRNFLETLKTLNGEGLCVVTSRMMPASLAGEKTVEIQLQALDHASSIEAFVAAGLSADCPELEAWATKSQGHPLLIALLAPAVESGHYDPDMFSTDQVVGDHNAKDIPDTVQNVVATRLTQLGEEARAVMYCMSLYGHAVSYGDLREELIDRKRIPLFTTPLYDKTGSTPGSSEVKFRKGAVALTKAAIVLARPGSLELSGKSVD